MKACHHLPDLEITSRLIRPRDLWQLSRAALHLGCYNRFMTEPVLAVPNSLLLLVHLHLLEYPSANNPEYDQNLFDPNVRGLRDRVNSMENMSYFLVGKIEGRKASKNKVSLESLHLYQSKLEP